MAYLRLKDSDTGRVYTIDRMLMSDAEWLHAEWGLEDLTTLSLFDIQQRLGYLCLAIRKEFPDLSEEEVLQQAREASVDLAPIEMKGTFFDEVTHKEIPASEVGKSSDPPSAVENSKLDGSDKDGEHGSPETTPVTAGTQD